MTILKIFLLALTFLIQSSWASQATLENTSVELLSEVESVKPGQPFWMAFKISMKPGWHTYWKNPGDSGLETRLTWELPEGFSVSPIQWLPPERIKQNGLTSFGYMNESYHLVQITPPNEITTDRFKLKLKANWLVCEESCIPEEADLEITLKTSKTDTHHYSEHKALVDELVKELPQKPQAFGEYRIEGDNVVFYLPQGFLIDKKISSLDLFSEEKGVVQNAASPHWMTKDNHLIIKVHKSHTFPDRLSTVIKITDAQTKEIESYYLYFGKVELPPISQGLEGTLLGILLLAFLGGLVLNAMPCVFPVLSLKAVSIAKKSHLNPRFVRQQGLLYTLGVILSFMTLAGVLIGLKQTGEIIGWGFQMQNPYFITFMAYLVFFVGLSLSGVVYLPILFGNTQANIDDQSSPWSSFLIGVLAVLVATPCTAPFMGAAIGYAITQSTPIIIMVFLSLATGFALPYLLISLFPVALKILPKPGRWMETFKEFMAFPMYATVAWLLWVLVQQAGSRGLIACLMGLVLIAFSIWLWDRKKTKSFFLNILLLGSLTALIMTPVYFLKQPQEIIQIEKFSRQRLQELRAEARPVFVYATAAWCITCKLNEVALKSNSTQLIFKNNNIALLEADWTNQDSEITDYLNSFGRSGVPLYTFYAKNEEAKVLPQLLTESIIVESVLNGGKK